MRGTKLLLGSLFVWFGLVWCVSRMPVGELFTTTWCTYCDDAAYYIDENFPPIEPVSIIVRYEVDEEAPFDDYDATGMNDRVSTYFSGSYGVPNMHIDGTDYGSGPYSTWISTLESRAGTSAPLDISFSDLTEDSVEITLTLEDPAYAGTHQLNVMIIEDSIYYSAPNGQTLFNQIFRSTITNSPYGDNVSLSTVKSPVVRKYALDLHPDWDVNNCFVVAFVQNTSTNEMLQGNRTPLLRPNYMFSVAPKFQTVSSIAEDTTANMNSTITNRGVNDDTYDVYADLLLPGGWTANTYAGGSSFSTFTTLSIVADGSDVISATINSNGISGSGTVRFRISSPNIPDRVDTVEFVLNAGA
ncbi:hypothetical protein DRQ33_03685, partial [bacterium]